DHALAPLRILDPAARGRLPRVRRIAPAAAQVALSEAHEQGRIPDMRSLALERGEDLDQVRTDGLTQDASSELHRKQEATSSTPLAHPMVFARLRLAARAACYPSTIERPIAISVISSSRRPGSRCSPWMRMRATGSSSGSAPIQPCFGARGAVTPPRAETRVNAV